jgi:hypothetical protein
MPVPDGVLLPYKGTNASIAGLSGWSRETDMDGLFAKQIPNSATDPGTTGGSSTHSHTSSGTHLHELDHAHTSNGATGNVSGSTDSSDGGTGASPASSSHTHTTPNSGTADINSGTAAPGSDSVSNDPINIEIIWIESDGTPTEIPTSSLVIYSGTDDLDDLTDDTDTVGRYLKGSATSSDGGTLNVGNSNHQHTINAHTHTGTSHSHTSGNTGGPSATVTRDNASGLRASSTHTHTVTYSNASTAALNSNTATSSSDDASLPPYINLRLLVSAGAPLQVGIIGGWLRPLSEIPEDWQLCDGTNGTVDLCTGNFIRGADGTSNLLDTGGSTSGHGHTGGSHVHTTSTHSHSRSYGSGSTSTNSGGTFNSAPLNTHTHSNSNSATATPTVGAATVTLSSQTTTPPYREMAFIQCMSVGPAAGTLFHHHARNWRKR